MNERCRFESGLVNNTNHCYKSKALRFEYLLLLLGLHYFYSININKNHVPFKSLQQKLELVIISQGLLCFNPNVLRAKAYML